nr:uncharacterized protein LOC129435994 [Misgurnus anguillicaudatus]
MKKSAQYRDHKEQFGDRWDHSCQQAFDLIIEKLTTSPVLGFADPKLPYILHTDASTTGLGAALYQRQEGQMRVIAFASRGLTKSETKYPAHKLEFLALKWAVTSKFNDYLYGAEFVVVTDSNPLTYILTSAKLDATSYRWLSSLSTYNFKLQYRAGSQNRDADGLSRRPHGEPLDDLVSQKERERIKQFTLHRLSETGVEDSVILPEAINAICERHQLREFLDDVGLSDASITLVKSLALHADVLPDGFEQEDEHGLPVIPYLSREELIKQQKMDPDLKVIMDWMEWNDKPPDPKSHPHTVALWIREWNRLKLIEGVLYRERTDQGVTHYQLTLPVALRGMVLKSLHDDMGHMSMERTIDLIRNRFFWPKMALAVEEKIKTCERCVRRKMPPEKAAALVNIKTTRPLELVCMDFLSLEPDRSNTKDILVITDHFTKYAVAIPTRNQKAQTVARCLWDNFFVHYGFPERLHSDQGPDFESRLIKELCDIAGVRKVRTTPYHPSGNPVERFNRTLLQMLGTLENKKKSCWKDFVRPMVHAYNCTRSDVTGYTPYELMFGRQPRLPVDLAFGLPVNKPTKTHSQYVKDLKECLRESYEIAMKTAAKVADRNKRRFDKHVVVSTLEVGDKVLVRNVKLRGKNKLADKWEPDVYVVLRKVEDIPVYTVQPEGRNGPVRTLHRDLLRPCGFIPASEDEESVPPKACHRPRTRLQTGNKAAYQEHVASSQSDSDDDLICIRNQEQQLEFTTTNISPSCRCPTIVPNLPEVKSGETPSATVNPEKENLPERLDEILIDNQARDDDGYNLPVMDQFSNDTTAIEPERENLQLKYLVGTDALNNLPVQNKQQDQGSVEPPSETLNEEDERGDGLIQDESVNLSTQDSLIETGQRVEDVPRRSQRHCEPPKRLQYPKLGNPLSLVVQSLLKGLSTAFTVSLEEPDSLKSTSVEMYGGYPSAIVSQPKRCSGTCISSRRGECNPGNPVTS